MKYFFHLNFWFRQWFKRLTIYVLVFAAILLYMFMPRVLSTDELGVFNIFADDNSVILECGISSSAIAYNNHSISKRNNSYFITVYGSLVTKSAHDGRFSVNIDFSEAAGECISFYFKDHSFEKIVYTHIRYN